MNGYLIFILAVIIVSYVLDFIIEFLNLKNITPLLPDEFKGTYDDERYQKSQIYLRENTITGLVNKSFFTLVLLVFILLEGFNYVDTFARSYGLGPISTGLIFTGILVISLQILELPFDVYDTFVIENKYGFNKTTVKTYILDMIKSSILALVLGGLIYSCILWFFGRFETWAWLFCWTALITFQLF